MRNRSYWATSKPWQTNLAAEKLPRAHDTNGQQIPEPSADVTSLVFPAIGAILILLFGGFLLSSGNSCCHVEASNKKKNDDESEAIDFPYMDSIYFPKPFPVLQQENNDVVDAVMETYSNLPQYAPMNELMTSIPGIIRHAQQAETRDACVSPIHCLNSIGAFPGNQEGCNQDDVHGSHDDNNDHVTNLKELPDNQEDDNDDLEQNQTQLDCTVHIKDNEDDDAAGQSSSFNISSGIGSCSTVSTPALFVDSSLTPENMRNLYIPINLHKGKRSRSRANASALSIDSGRMSDGMRRTPVDPLQEIKKALNASFGLGEAVTSIPLTIDDEANKEGHKPKKDSETTAYHWKRPMKLSKQDRLEILKRLQPNLNAIESDSINTSATSSSNREDTIHRDKVEQRNVGGYIVNTHGGRLSCLKVERAPSSMCIHGNICRYNCKSNHVTANVECRKDDSGRGASYLGMTPTPIGRGVGEFAETTHGVCDINSHSREEGSFVDTARGAREPHDDSMRGASAFDASGCTSIKVDDHIREARENDTHVRGASAFDENDSNLLIKREQRPIESDTQIRGASAFAENDPAQTKTMQSQKSSTSKSNAVVYNMVTSNCDDYNDPRLKAKCFQNQENFVSQSNKLLDNSPTLNHADNYKKAHFRHQKGRPTSKCTEKDASMEFRGASGFGQSYADCVSITGTASVTLSMAVQSEREDVTLTNITQNIQSNATELMNGQHIEEHNEGPCTAHHYQGKAATELVEGQQKREVQNERQQQTRECNEGQDIVLHDEVKYENKLMEGKLDLELQNEGQQTTTNKEMQLQTEGHNETTLSVNHRIFNVNSEFIDERTKQSLCTANVNKNTSGPVGKEPKSHCNTNMASAVDVNDLSSRYFEQANQSNCDKNTTHSKSLKLLRAHREMLNKISDENNEICSPSREGAIVGSHTLNTTGSYSNRVEETIETMEAKTRGIATSDVTSRHAIANGDKSSNSVDTFPKRVDLVTKDRKSHDAVATSNVTRNHVDRLAESSKSHDINGKLRDVNTNDQRSLEFNPSRSSTPYDKNNTPSVHNVPMATKTDHRVLSLDKMVESKDDGTMNSAVEKADMPTRAPKMSLGRNPQALSGLLKALQREKRKKDCVTESDCVTSKDHNLKSNSEGANGTMRVTEKDCADENCVTDINCVKTNDCVTSNSNVINEGYVTGNNKMTNQDCVTDNNCVTNKHCITDSDSRTLKILSEKLTTGNSRSNSPEGSDVTHSGQRKQVIGKLKVCLFYSKNNVNKPVLYVTVLKASSLRHELVQSDEDLYIQMRLNTRDDKVQQTKSVSILSNTAVFNHLFQVHDITLRELQVSTIKMVLVSGQCKQEEAIANIPLAELVARDKIKKTYLLKRHSPQTNKVKKREPKVHIPVGSLYLGLKYNSVDEKLLVNINKARGLPSMSSWGQTDPYIILTVKDDGKIMDEKITCTQWNQRNPQFDANFVLEISRERIGKTSLLLRVMNNSANHSVIGAVEIGMESLEDAGRHHWESILDQDAVHDERWHKLFK